MVILKSKTSAEGQKHLDKDIQGSKLLWMLHFSAHEAHGLSALDSSLLISHYALQYKSTGFHPDGAGSHLVAWLMCKIPENGTNVSSSVSGLVFHTCQDSKACQLLKTAVLS